MKAKPTEQPDRFPRLSPESEIRLREVAYYLGLDEAETLERAVRFFHQRYPKLRRTGASDGK